MRGEYVDDGIQRQQPHEFVGRERLLDDFDRLVLRDSVDRCVALTGGQGKGKTACVASWLARCEASYELVFHHFIRRQQGDRLEPWVVARSLATQIENRFPHLRDPYARPEGCLAGVLTKLSRELAARGSRIALVIDGIEERGSGGGHRDVLAFLPRGRLPGIRLLMAGRLRDPRSDLQDQFAQLVVFDLDDEQFADDNEATVRLFWRREAVTLELDPRFVEQAIRCSDGNMLHASLLRRHVAAMPNPQRRPETIPRDLPSLLATLWRRVEPDHAAVRALEILCAAREPLSLEQLGRVAGVSDPGELRGTVNLARDLIVATQRRDRVAAYEPTHDAVRELILQRLDAAAIRDVHRELADKLATWPAPRDPVTRRYALRYAVNHRIAAGDCRATHALAGNLDFLEAKCSELWLDEVELDVRRAAEACLTAGHLGLQSELDLLRRSIAGASSSLRREPGADSSALWNRLRQGKGEPQGVESRAPSTTAPVGSAVIPPAPPRPTIPLVRPTIGPGSPTVSFGRPALLGALHGRGGAVTACAVTPDSRRLVAAYADRSLKVWDLEHGRMVATMTGHTGVIESCTVTPDGQHVVSTSADTTLRVWELHTGSLRATLEGHTGAVKSCAVTADSACIVSASADTTLKVWNLGTGEVLATLEGHADAVNGCAITPDGTCVVSASVDATLKLWELATGNELATLRGHTDAVACCAIFAHGRLALSGSADHALKAWDLTTGDVTATLKGHTGPVTSCAVAPDCRSVYSGSLDTTLRIWDVDTCRTVTTLEGHTGPVTCCVVTPDGRRLLSGSSDTTLRVWALDGSRTSSLPGKRPTTLVARAPAMPTVALRPHKPPGSKPVILFLAANPKGRNRQVLEDECAAIERELCLARHGTDFEFSSKCALTVDDMARHLLDLDPTIVHFRGQGRTDSTGSQSATLRQAGPHEDSGIYLHDERHEVQLVTGRALKMIVGNSAPSARVVVLNACYSDGHAAELCQVVDCVVGMARDHDCAARSFAVAFYRALGHRRSVGDAVAHAVATLAVKQLPDECVPRCRTPNWVDAHEITLHVEHASE
jgi:hypothetical protein